MRIWIIAAALALGSSALAQQSAAPTDPDLAPPPTNGVDQPQHRPPEREPAPPDIIAPSATGGSGEAGAPEQSWDAPARSLDKARSEIPARPNESAKDLESVARMLEEYRNAVSGEVRDELSTAHQDLDQLATDVRTRGVTSADQANQPIAEAYNAIASYHQARAQDAWGLRDSKRVGEELEASAHYLERAAELAERSSAEAAVAAARDARRLANKLEEGAKVAPSEVEKEIDNLGKSIDRLGREIKPPRASGRRAQPTH